MSYTISIKPKAEKYLAGIRDVSLYERLRDDERWFDATVSATYFRFMPATKSAPYLPHEIEYTRNITRELVEQHKRAWQDKGKHLVSAILFGPLAGSPPEYDENIPLLEVVEGYPASGGTVHEFQSTRQFPMYGRLRLRIMSPEEFKKAVTDNSSAIAEIRDQKEFLFDHRHFAQKLLR